MRKIFPYFVNAIICIAIVLVYHFYGKDLFFTPETYYSVDFRKLSDLKMAESLQQAKDGKPVNAKELQNFIINVQKKIKKLSNGKPVFITNAFFDGNTDLTEKLIKELNLKETKMYEYIKKTEIQDKK